MTGRERLDAILNRRPAEGLSWTTLVDPATLQHLPARLRGNGGLDLYRHLGCDILLLNGWGTGQTLSNPTLLWPTGTKEVSRSEGDGETRELQSGFGTLKATYRGDRPMKPFVSSAEELRLFLRLWEGARYEFRDDTDSLAGITRAIGDDGLSVAFWGPSTIPRLLEYDMGAEAFYYLLQDEPLLMDDLIRVMHERELVAFQCLAQGPFSTIILCENTSTYYLGPEIYRRYNGPHVRDFVDIVHAAGKTAIVHMCGHIVRLLDQIRLTGLDGIHGLTPPPTGDTPWEAALDALGDEQVLIGVLDPTIFITGPVSEIAPALDRLYTRRLRRSHFVLWPAADGVRVPLERFEAVADWMERNGRR